METHFKSNIECCANNNLELWGNSDIPGSPSTGHFLN